MTALIVSETPLTGPTVEALKGGQRQGALCRRQGGSVGWGWGRGALRAWEGSRTDGRSATLGRARTARGGQRGLVQLAPPGRPAHV